MALPVSYNRVPVRGRFVDLKGDPVAGSLSFTPTVGSMLVPGEKVTVIGTPLLVWLVDGQFETHIPATNDPDVIPTGFLYLVQEKFNGVQGRTYQIAVPLEGIDGGLDLSVVVPPENVDEPFVFTQLLLDGGTSTSTFS